MGFQSCSPFIKVGLFLDVFAVGFAVVALFSPFWLVNDLTEIQLGVFYHCVNGHCSSSGDSQDWQKALAAMEICGLLCALPCLVFDLLFVFVPAKFGKKWVKVVTAILAFGATLFILIGVILCAIKKDDFPEQQPGFRLTFNLSWSFALAVIGGLLHLATAVCFLLD